MVLVDSSVWIDLLRGGETPQVVVLKELLATDEAALAPVIYQEVLQGAAAPGSLKKLSSYFRSLPFLLPLHPIETYEAAATLYARARWKGLTPRSPHDCLVAQIAVEHGVRLLHDDEDFKLLRQVEHRLKLLSVPGV